MLFMFINIGDFTSVTGQLYSSEFVILSFSASWGLKNLESC